MSVRNKKGTPQTLDEARDSKPRRRESIECKLRDEGCDIIDDCSTSVTSFKSASSDLNSINDKDVHVSTFPVNGDDKPLCSDEQFSAQSIYRKSDDARDFPITTDSTKSYIHNLETPRRSSITINSCRNVHRSSIKQSRSMDSPTWKVKTSSKKKGEKSPLHISNLPSFTGISRHTIRATLTPPSSPMHPSFTKNPALSTISPFLNSFRMKFRPSPINTALKQMRMDYQLNGGVELSVSDQITPSRWRIKNNKTILILRHVHEVIPNFDSFHTNLRRHLTRRGVEVSPQPPPITLSKTLSNTFSIAMSISSASTGALVYNENDDVENDSMSDHPINTSSLANNECGIPHVQSMGSLRRLADQIKKRWRFVDKSNSTEGGEEEETPIGCLSILSIDADSVQSTTNETKSQWKKNHKPIEEEFLQYELMTRELLHCTHSEDEIDVDRVVSSADSQSAVVRMMSLMKSMRFDESDDHSTSTASICKEYKELEQQLETGITHENIIIPRYDERNNERKNFYSERKLGKMSNHKEPMGTRNRKRSHSWGNTLSVPSLERNEIGKQQKSTKITQNLKNFSIPLISDELSLQNRDVNQTTELNISNIVSLSDDFSDESIVDFRESISALSDLPACSTYSPLRGSILFHEDSSITSETHHKLFHSHENDDERPILSFPSIHDNHHITHRKKNSSTSFELLDPPNTQNLARSQNSYAKTRYDLFLPGNHDLDDRNISTLSESMSTTSSFLSKEIASETAFSHVMTNTFLFNVENLRRSESQLDEMSKIREEASIGRIVNAFDVKKSIDKFKYQNYNPDEFCENSKRKDRNTKKYSCLERRASACKQDEVLRSEIMIQDGSSVSSPKSCRDSSPDDVSLHDCNESTLPVSDLDCLQFLRENPSNDSLHLISLYENEGNSNSETEKHSSALANMKNDEAEINTYLKLEYAQKYLKPSRNFRNRLIQNEKKSLDATNSSSDKNDEIPHMQTLSVQNKNQATFTSRRFAHPLSLIEQLDNNTSFCILTFLDIRAIYYVSLTSRTMLAKSESDELWKIRFRERWNTWTDKLFGDSTSFAMEKNLNRKGVLPKSYWKKWYSKYANSKSDSFWMKGMKSSSDENISSSNDASDCETEYELRLRKRREDMTTPPLSLSFLFNKSTSKNMVGLSSQDQTRYDEQIEIDSIVDEMEENGSMVSSNENESFINSRNRSPSFDIICATRQMYDASPNNFKETSFDSYNPVENPNDQLPVSDSRNLFSTVTSENQPHEMRQHMSQNLPVAKGERKYEMKSPSLAITPNNDIEIFYRDELREAKLEPNYDIIERERCIEDDDVAFLTNYLYNSKQNLQIINVKEMENKSNPNFPPETETDEKSSGFGQEYMKAQVDPNEDLSGLGFLFCNPELQMSNQKSKINEDKFLSISGDLSTPNESSWTDYIFDWLFGSKEKEKQFENFRAPTLKLKNKNNINNSNSTTIIVPEIDHMQPRLDVFHSSAY